MFEKIIRTRGIRSLVGPLKFSAFMGSLAERKMPKWILNPILNTYVKYYRIDMDDYVREVSEFTSFIDFFTRKLKSDVRTFDGKLVSPAESVITDYGMVRTDMVVDVKGMGCKLSVFLKRIVTIDFKSFAIFYLSPADYHRFHAPFDMEVEKIVYLPGDLYSVKPRNVERYDTLFCDNRKVVIYGSCEFGKFAMVLVGALVVGKIVLNFGQKQMSSSPVEESVSISFHKGDELGAFELGSTVILLTDSDVLSRIKVARVSMYW